MHRFTAVLSGCTLAWCGGCPSRQPDPPPVGPVVVRTNPAGAGTIRTVVGSPPAGQPHASTTPPAQRVGIRFVNATLVELCGLYASPVEDDMWGPNLLTGQVLRLGSQVILPLDLSHAEWDVMTEDCDGQAVTEIRGQAVPGSHVWTLYPPAGDVTTPVDPARYGFVRVRIVNSTWREVCYLYIHPSGDPRGEELLGAWTLHAGWSAALTLDSSIPAWDLEAEACDRSGIAEARNEPIPPEGVWEFAEADAPDRRPSRSATEIDLDTVPRDGETSKVADAAFAAAYALGVSRQDMVHLGDRECESIRDRDLRRMCLGECETIGDGDMRQLCLGECDRIDDADLERYCLGDCDSIEDEDVRDLCGPS